MRKSSPLPRRQIAPLPRQQSPSIPKRQIELLPLPRKQSPSIPKRQIELLPLPRKQLVPLPSSRQSPRSPRLPQTNKKQSQLSDRLEKATNATRLQASMRRQLAQYKKNPTNLSNILKEVQALIFTHVINENFESIDIKNILNTEIIVKLSPLSHLFEIKSFKEQHISFENIDIIDLTNLKITKEILSILKMTDRKKITKIILSDITFNDDKTMKMFLMFLSKNTEVQKLVLYRIELDFNILLVILRGLKKLRMLEINRNNLLECNSDLLINLLTGLNNESIHYLVFFLNKLDTTKSRDLVELLTKGRIIINGVNLEIRKESKIWKIVVSRNSQEINKISFDCSNNSYNDYIDVQDNKINSYASTFDAKYYSF